MNSVSSRVFTLRALARAELSNADKAKQIPQEFRIGADLSFSGMTEDEACITMESLAELRAVDKNTSKVFFDYLWDDGKRFEKLSLQNKIRACAGLRELRTHQPKHRHVLSNVTRLLDYRQELMKQGLFVDALRRVGRLGPLDAKRKHLVTSSVLDSLEEGLDNLWALPRALQALHIHDEKIFLAYADCLRVEAFSFKEMLELVRGLQRWEVGPPGMKRCALTVYCNLYPPTPQGTYLWIRALSRIKLSGKDVLEPAAAEPQLELSRGETEGELHEEDGNESQGNFMKNLFTNLPGCARMLNAERLVLLANALTFGFPYDNNFRAVAKEIEKQLPLEVYDFECLATLFRASWYLKSPELAAALRPRILEMLPLETSHKAASKVMYAAAQWAKEDVSYIPVIDAVLPLTRPTDRVQVLPLATNPAPIVRSVADDLSHLSRRDLRACSLAVQETEVAEKIISEFERIGIVEDDIWCWMQPSGNSVHPLMRPLIEKHASDRTLPTTLVGAACRDVLFWDKHTA